MPEEPRTIFCRCCTTPKPRCSTGTVPPCIRAMPRRRGEFVRSGLTDVGHLPSLRSDGNIQAAHNRDQRVSVCCFVTVCETRHLAGGGLRFHKRAKPYRQAGARCQRGGNFVIRVAKSHARRGFPRKVLWTIPNPSETAVISAFSHGPIEP
jgi:hypothetical protein